MSAAYQADEIAAFVLEALPAAERRAFLQLLERQAESGERVRCDAALRLCRSAGACADIVLPALGYGREARVRRGECVAPTLRWVDLLDVTDRRPVFMRGKDLIPDHLSLGLWRTFFPSGHLRVLRPGEFLHC